MIEPMQGMEPAENSTGWRIHPELLNHILLEYRYVDHEIGGVLGLRCGTVIRSIKDTEGYSDARIYRSNPDRIAAAIRSLLQADKCDQICFIHSHPSEHPSPSYADIRFVRLFLQMNPVFENAGMAIVAGNTLNMFCLYRSSYEIAPSPMGRFLGSVAE